MTTPDWLKFVAAILNFNSAPNWLKFEAAILNFNSAPDWLKFQVPILDLKNNRFHCSPNNSLLSFSAPDWLLPKPLPYTTTTHQRVSANTVLVCVQTNLVGTDSFDSNFSALYFTANEYKLELGTLTFQNSLSKSQRLQLEPEGFQPITARVLATRTADFSIFRFR